MKNSYKFLLVVAMVILVIFLVIASIMIASQNCPNCNLAGTPYPTLEPNLFP